LAWAVLPAPPPAEVVYCAAPEGRFDQVENDIVRRLMWSALLAASSALASVVAARLAAVVWRRVFDEEPPE
jgi:hypothetical protein